MVLTLCLLFCFSNVVMSIESIEVQTSLGKVRGKFVNDATTGALYYSFEGIPYAEPPLGNLRFKPPVQKRPWSNVFNATKPGYVCPQTELYHSRREMNEDCLTFNIFTPANYRNKLLPVIFNIHGGDFYLLSGKTEPIYGPQLLILNDIVVVTMNFRLSALGFLSLCTEDVSGNAGIKDLILGFKLVYKNIKAFGGDPNKITIMGNGGGAAMAEYLILTNKINGMFQSAILRGGTTLSPKYIQLNPKENAKLLGRELGLDVSSNDRLIKGLRKVNAFDIIEAQLAIDQKDPQRGARVFRPFKPTVEIRSSSAVLTKAPLDIMREGAAPDIPLLNGFNNEEGLQMFRLLRREPELIDRLNKNMELLVPSNINYPFGSAERRNLAARIRDFYFDGGNISFVNVQNYINLISDVQYTYPIDHSVKLFKEKQKSPLYYAIFTGDTELNWFKIIANITYPGAAHFDNLGYAFITSVTKSRYPYLHTNAKRIQDTILLNIKTFINKGKPVPNAITNCWPEAGQDRFHLIQDYNSIAVYHRPLPERIGFWYSVYEEFLASKYNVNSFC